MDDQNTIPYGEDSASLKLRVSELDRRIGNFRSYVTISVFAICYVVARAYSLDKSFFSAFFVIGGAWFLLDLILSVARDGWLYRKALEWAKR